MQSNRFICLCKFYDRLAHFKCANVFVDGAASLPSVVVEADLCECTLERQVQFQYQFCSAKNLASQKRIVGKECDMYGETGNVYKSVVENLKERTAFRYEEKFDVEKSVVKC